MKRENLFTAVRSEYITKKWDEKTYVFIILKGIKIFELVNNSEIMKDLFGFIDEENSFSEKLKKYELIGYDENIDTLYIYISEIIDPKLILKRIVEILLEKRWDFEIFNLMSLSDSNPLIKWIDETKLGKDLMGIYTYEGREEFVITEDQPEELKELLEGLERI